MAENEPQEKREPETANTPIILGGLFAYLIPTLPEIGDVITIQPEKILVSPEIHPVVFANRRYELTNLMLTVPSPQGPIPAFGIHLVEGK